MRRGIRGHFYAGLIVILPLFLTIFIINWVVNLIVVVTKESFLTTFIKNAIIFFRIENNIHLVTVVYILYLLSILIFITFIGYIAKNIVGKKITRTINKLIGKLPIVKHIYTTINQIVNVISSEKGNTYKRAVAIEYPRKGIYSIGFLTSEKNELLSKVVDKELCNIFIPTSPNPTSGMFISVAKEEVIFLDIKIDDAVKLIISGGVIVPGVESEEESEEE
ncbi:DUF502 domain-containing protein [Fusobacterium sp.]|uniref:DUF502 domain-containing protein n=1 Tax=Fusobacterium sp. TaxID=68766 RepID=UPI0026047132|nr:DUF502 domain-containing protein [Fusobacterium sp.]